MQFANVLVLAAALIVTIAPALLAPRLIAQLQLQPLVV